MKIEKLNFERISTQLSREEMRKIMAGSGNPNCDGISGTYNWYCCKNGGNTFLGFMTCDQASDRCDGTKIALDPDRCNI